MILILILKLILRGNNMKTYGLPYQGSKNSLSAYIIDTIVATLGNIEHYDVYDLFGGGGAMSIAFENYSNIFSEGFKSVTYNEYDTQIYELMKTVVNDKESIIEWANKWITREEFYMHKDDKNAYGAFLSLCWSFNRMRKTYIYSKKDEEIKRLMYELYYNPSEEFYNKYWGFDGLNIDFLHMQKMKNIRQRSNYVSKLYKAKKKRSDFIYNEFERKIIEGAWHCNNIRDILRVLDFKNSFNLQNLSYEKVELNGNPLLYCDPPYKDTAGYREEFDHGKFYEWIDKMTLKEIPVFVSEYTCPPNMVEIGSKDKKANSNNIHGYNLRKDYIFWNGVS